MTTQISKEHAKALIEESDAGVIAVLKLRSVPVLGHLEDEKPQIEIVSGTYRFGDERIYGD